MTNIVYHLRDPARSLLQTLNKVNCIYIEGPPGCGKSSLVWYWCLMQAIDKSLLCIQFSLVDKVYSLANNNLSYAGFNSEDINNIIDSANCDILILDGITSDQIQIIKRALSWQQKSVIKYRKLIIVTSMQINIKPEQLKIWGIKNYLLPPWNYEEYKEAMKNNDFKKLVLPNLERIDVEKDSINSKYFYAGGSARWMFDFTIDEVIRIVNNHMSRVPDFNLISKGLNGTRSDTINHLLSVNRDYKTYIVSEYVTRELSLKLESQVLKL